MQVMHTHMGVLHTVYIPIQAKADYPTMIYLPTVQRVVPSMLKQANLPAQILKEPVCK